MRKTFTLYFFLQSLLLFSQTTIYVNQNVQGGLQNGSSWANAYPDLQQAIGIVEEGDSIWVAAGNYKPAATSDRSISFQLMSGTALYGGFNGTETMLHQRDPAANPTILSGEIGDTSLRADNSFHVVRGKGLGNNTLIDGFTITNGYSFGESTPLTLDGYGAGMLLEGSPALINSQPVISNCIFARNACYAGGGLCTTWTDPDNPWLGENLVNPILRNCSFQYNRAYFGGGAFYVNSPSGIGDTLEIWDCSFTDNYVYLWGGGGLYFSQTENTNVRLVTCLFEQDSAPQGTLGGAIYFGAVQSDSTMATLAMDSCVFRKNIASEGAGLFYAGEVSFAKAVDFYCHMRSCLFEANKTTNGGSGSAYTISSAMGGGKITTEVTDCVFKDNLAGNFTTTIGGFGDGESKTRIERCIFLNNRDVDNPNEICLAIQCGASGSLTTTRKLHTRINNCLFGKNGGGIAALVGDHNYAKTEVTNCTFFDNNEYVFVKSKINSSQQGYHNDMYLNNCVVWELKTDGIRMFYNNDPNLYVMYGFHVENTMITVPTGFWQWPGAQQVFGDGVIFNEYPQFVDTLVNDFRLQPCSPAINAGNNVVADTFGLTTDLLSNPRIFLNTVDLGAYETLDSCITIGNHETQDALFTIMVSPNPTTDGVTINIQPQTEGNIRVTDPQGRVVQESRMLGGLAFLSTVGLQYGMYTVQILSKEGRIIGLRKLVVQH